MTIISQLQLLQDLIEDATADVGVDRIAITAGRPAAPSGEDCTAIYIFVDNLTDENQADPNACEVRSRLAMQFEIWVCYPEDWDDVDTLAHLEAAERLYEIAGLIWCALVDAKDTCEPFGDCTEFLELTPLQAQPRLGQMVSMLGGLTVAYDCTPVDTSP